MKKLYLLATIFLNIGLLSCSSGVVPQANYQIIPLPQEISIATGEFELNNKTVIVYPKGNNNMEENANLLAKYIRQMSGKELKVTDQQITSNAIILANGLISDNAEAYQLKVTQNNISIVGASDAGTYYGIQTLRKSMPISNEGNVIFPAVEINDYPRFPYRGVHLDVSRHFFPTDSIKRFIDMIALHNINRLHWHLTDDQGWRIEIKKYPKLTTIGSIRSETVLGHNSLKYDSIPYKGFYTQEEAKEIIEYAQKRHITIIPEIDLPGHMQAALAAYPNLGCTGGPYKVWNRWGISEEVLCAGNDQTLQFIDNVLNEIVDIFPSEYIHIGGDECPKTRWEKCPKCQARIKNNGLKADNNHTAEQKLQSYLINHAEQFLRGKGRRIIGWEEILEGGLAPNATVMSWRGIEGGIEAVKHKHNAIMTPSSFLYFDYYQSMDTDNEPMANGGYLPVEKVYSYEPVPEAITADEAKQIIGVQANLWTEYIPNYSQVEYMELPRLAALSEVQWTLPEKKDYANFLKRLPGLIAIYDMEHYNYAKHIFHVKVNFIPDTIENVLKIALSTIDNAPIYYTLDNTEPTLKSTGYTDTLKIDHGCTLKAITVRPNGSSSVLKEDIDFNKATAKPITMLQPINEKYKFKGKNTLIDGLAGSKDYRTGRWIAFYKNDMVAVIDLQQLTSISKAWIRNYVEIGEEILDLRKMSVEVSDDGQTFKPVKSEVYPAISKDSQNGIYTHELTFNSVQTRYVKLTAQPEYTIPDWHWGKGRPAFIFIDEIGLE